MEPRKSTVANPERNFDIVVFGATGFTGKLTAEYLVLKAPKDLRLAIAGRSRAKLEELKAELSKLTPRATELGVLVADVGDQAALDSVVRQARVIATTAGPFAKYGTPVVDACVRFGVHYADITGEAHWIRTIIEKYHDKAAAEGTLIVPCCGMDCIPSDLGTFMVIDHMRTKLNRQAAFVKAGIESIKSDVSGGTIASIFEAFEGGQGRTAASPYCLNGPERPKVKSSDHFKVSWDEHFKKWAGLNPLATGDLRIVNRSNALANFAYGPNFRFTGFTLSRSWFRQFAFLIAFGVFFGLAALAPGRWLLKKFLRAPGQGTSREAMENGSLFMRIIGGTEPQGNEKQKLVHARVVYDVDPGYLGTARTLGESALCLALSRDRLGAGGVMTPASGLGHVLLDRLRAANLQFSIDRVDS
eukprot:TRINITY_DN2481_c0_g1_i1.p1 TRINITY_DN2481_c0_g1~~TRINITY_DN2481_c0_g1_i1.p1  ORF type:complete len:435 (+),score=103.25 TRINITY_DN2481_c0_g1_i1:58-1305(+)